MQGRTGTRPLHLQLCRMDQTQRTRGVKRGRCEDGSRAAVERAAGPLLMGSSHAVLTCLEEVTSLPAVLSQLIMGYRGDRDINSTGGAFAAKLADGRVVMWAPRLW